MTYKNDVSLKFFQLFEIFTAVTAWTVLFRIMKPCGLERGYQYFGWTRYLLLLDRRRDSMCLCVCEIVPVLLHLCVLRHSHMKLLGAFDCERY
jgi:hypothetical protein